MRRSRTLSFETLCDRRVLENHAPVLDTTTHPNLTPAIVDNEFSNGTRVSDFAGSRTSDPDAAAVKGIAIIGLTERFKGRWAYSTDGGGSWTSLGNGFTDDPYEGAPPSDEAALVLGPNDRVLFTPQGGYVGIPQLKFRAWDQTDGAARGAIVDISDDIGGGGCLQQRIP